MTVKETDPAPNEENVDWSLTTWEGARREQMRRAAEIPFDHILDAIEEMGDLAAELAAQATGGRVAPSGSSLPHPPSVREKPSPWPTPEGPVGGPDDGQKREG